MVESGPSPVTEYLPVNDEDRMKEMQQRYEDMIWDLVEKQGFTPRKARRYLESEARRNARRIVRAGKRRQTELRRSGGLVDVSDLTKQLEAEFQEQLAALPAEEPKLTVDIETQEYKSPTNEF